MGETFVAKRVESNGGQVSGLNEESGVPSAVSFMIKSLTNKFRDVIGIDIMKLVHEAGLNFVAILVDNFATNHRFFLYLLCGGEWKPFIVFTTHIQAKKFSWYLILLITSKTCKTIS